MKSASHIFFPLPFQDPDDHKQGTHLASQNLNQVFDRQYPTPPIWRTLHEENLQGGLTWESERGLMMWLMEGESWGGECVADVSG
jgi:hypothetical protein